VEVPRKESHGHLRTRRQIHRCEARADRRDRQPGRGGAGPAAGRRLDRFKLLVDENQGTAIFVGFFDTEEKMQEAARVLEQMDASETPGTRASIDQCEVKVEGDA
jgi:hypothetical protein